MIQWGINALNHGSSLAVFKDGNFLGDIINKEAEELAPEMYKRFIEYYGTPDRIFWYENPWIKKARQVYAKQYKTAFKLDNLPGRALKKWGLGYAPVTYTSHHASHAAAGYYTSPFNHCAIVVLDAIGEFDCASIWEGKHGEMKKVWSARYPNSLGLFYSAFTQFVGLTPIRDEYILQKMAAQGDPKRFRSSIDLYFRKGGPISLDYNFHRGVLNWSAELMNLQEQCDLAAAVQERFEIEVAKVMYKAKELTSANSLVYMGGCAMNSAANKNVVEPMFKYIWSLPEPGDASSAIGAVLYHTRNKVRLDLPSVKHIAINV
jgi:carbamoyltransferase